MSHRIAFLSVAAAAFGVAALPHAASAADYYDEGGRRPAVYHSQDDVFIDGDRARIEHRQDLRPGLGYGYRRAPGPVVFDERGLDRRYGPPAYGFGRDDGFGPEYGHRRPVIVGRPADGDDRPVGYGPRFDRPYGAEVGYGVPVPAYRAVSAPVYGEAYEGRGDLPDVGCTVQEAQSTTPAGWRKTVTHRTCYRR